PEGHIPSSLFPSCFRLQPGGLHKSASLSLLCLIFSVLFPIISTFFFHDNARFLLLAQHRLYTVYTHMRPLRDDASADHTIIHSVTSFFCSAAPMSSGQGSQLPLPQGRG